MNPNHVSVIIAGDSFAQISGREVGRRVVVGKNAGKGEKGRLRRNGFRPILVVSGDGMKTPKPGVRLTPVTRSGGGPKDVRYKTRYPGKPQ